MSFDLRCVIDSLYSSYNVFMAKAASVLSLLIFRDCKWIEVFDRIKDLQRECGESNIVWTLLGARTCRRAWRTLHCIGPRVTNDSFDLNLKFCCLGCPFLRWGCVSLVPIKR